MLVKLILKGIFYKVIFTLEQYRYNVIVSKRLNEVNCPSVSMLFVPYPLTQHQPEKAIIKTVVKCPFFGLFRAREEAQRDPIENPSFFVYVALLLLCCMQEAGQYLEESPVPRDLAAPPETPGIRTRRLRDAAIADSRAMRAAIIPVSTSQLDD